MRSGTLTAASGESVMQNTPCRLCGGTSAEKFHLHGLKGIDITYFECVNCGSLQTQEPTWLREAYAHSNLSDLDTGAAQRVVGNHAFVLVAAKIFRLQTILDFGGGDGLLCRLLRDRGLDARTIDDHATPTYARLFEGSLTRNYDLITAFEVFEHLPHPSVSLKDLFQSKPRFIIASTEIYSGQDATWWYLAPHQGQHVFFYSRDALRSLASHHRYSYYEINGRHVFAKEPLTRPRLWAISHFTSGRLFQIFRATLPFSETWTWVLRDLTKATVSLGDYD
jgi:2-polyprenyl-3-methyl-5-hydroxy-6-metoxy-1,4-benzoquinol methylase